jgi:ABC-type amino acid transport substrate-binding protein
MKRSYKRYILALGAFLALYGTAFADGLSDIRTRGVLRHLGVPYANFVTGAGDGLSVEVIQLFAEHLGVKYQFVKTSWNDVFPDLLGREVHYEGDNATLGKSKPIRGDIIDNGLTVLAWRQKVVSFSKPTFPNQVWLISRTGGGLKPIRPTGDITKDIAAVKALVNRKTLLGKNGTCLEPSLYGLKEAGARTSSYRGNLNEMAPAVINGLTDTAILDVPDVLVALEKWPGQILVIGPVSPQQEMSAAFRPSDTLLLQEFNRFMDQIRKDGRYRKLIEKYYPAVLDYYPDFF